MVVVTMMEAKEAGDGVKSATKSEYGGGRGACQPRDCCLCLRDTKSPISYLPYVKILNLSYVIPNVYPKPWYFPEPNQVVLASKPISALDS